MEELTKALLELKNELDNSPYELDRQECTMFAYAAGYAPEASVRDVWELIDKILRGVIL